MNRIKLFFQYRKMLRTMHTVHMYDGRGQGTDVYVCSAADLPVTETASLQGAAIWNMQTTMLSLSLLAIPGSTILREG